MKSDKSERRRSGLFGFGKKDKDKDKDKEKEVSLLYFCCVWMDGEGRGDARAIAIVIESLNQRALGPAPSLSFIHPLRSTTTTTVSYSIVTSPVHVVNPESCQHSYRGRSADMANSTATPSSASTSKSQPTPRSILLFRRTRSGQSST